MDPESKKLLEDTYSLEQENNHMLHKVRNFQKWTTFWSVFKILLIIGIAFGSFIFLDPYVTKVIDTWKSISGTEQKSGTVSPIQEFLRNIGI